MILGDQVGNFWRVILRAAMLRQLVTRLYNVSTNIQTALLILLMKLNL